MEFIAICMLIRINNCINCCTYNVSCFIYINLIKILIRTLRETFSYLFQKIIKRIGRTYRMKWYKRCPRLSSPFYWLFQWFIRWDSNRLGKREHLFFSLPARSVRIIIIIKIRKFENYSIGEWNSIVVQRLHNCLCRMKPLLMRVIRGSDLPATAASRVQIQIKLSLAFYKTSSSRSFPTRRRDSRQRIFTRAI